MLNFEEKQEVKRFLTEGFRFPIDLNVPDLTMQMWQDIKELPYELDVDFNMIGDSSVLKVLRENEAIVNVNIKPDGLDFRLAKPQNKFSRDDSISCIFAVMRIANTCRKSIKEAITT